MREGTGLALRRFGVHSWQHQKDPQRYLGSHVPLKLMRVRCLTDLWRSMLQSFWHIYTSTNLLYWPGVLCWDTQGSLAHTFSGMGSWMTVSMLGRLCLPDMVRSTEIPFVSQFPIYKKQNAAMKPITNTFPAWLQTNIVNYLLSPTPLHTGSILAGRDHFWLCLCTAPSMWGLSFGGRPNKGYCNTNDNQVHNNYNHYSLLLSRYQSIL